MLITIDIGNSNILIGLFAKEKISHSWRITANPNSTTDEYANSILLLFSRNKISIENIKKVLIASVVPALNKTFFDLFTKIFKKPTEILKVDEIPIKDDVALRQEVGIDRLLNAYSGFKKYKKPLIIIDFGTAITFDIVDEKGVYLGGIISPSMRIASEALSQKAAKLPQVDFTVPKKIIGKNTIESMHSGMFFGYIGMINSCIDKIQEEQQKPFLKIITGGDAKLLKKYIKIDCLEQELTLWGMYFIYIKKNG